MGGGGFLLDCDAVLVGGGNTANLLAIWRMHGLDRALQAAWEAGVVLAGWSAGMLCWFEAGVTDSFGVRRRDPLHDGLGLLAGSACPHYDGEAQRRPTYRRLPRRVRRGRRCRPGVCGR
jgi:dipeptidase E